MELAAEKADDKEVTCNPTNAVGGAFILGLQGTLGRGFPNPTNASWWFRSYSAYTGRPIDGFPNPTHGSRWIVQVRPTTEAARPFGFGYLSPLAPRGEILPSRREGREGKTGISGVPYVGWT
jgi:hypothetical protein